MVVIKLKIRNQINGGKIDISENAVFLFKVINGNTGKKSEIRSELPIKTPKSCHCCKLFVNLGQIPLIVLLLLQL